MALQPPADPADSIAAPIHSIRGRNVMFSRDLAKLYGVPTQTVNNVIRRHRARFPEALAFQLTRAEFDYWVSQGALSKPKRGGSGHPPWVLTEDGVAMISILMPGKRSIRVNRITGWDKVTT